MTDIPTPSRPMASAGGAPAKPPKPFNPVQLPDEAAGIEAIAHLARNGEFPRIEMVATEGFGAGLPPRVPLLFHPGRTGDVKPIAQAFEAYRQAPARRTGTATATTLASFIELVNRHKDDDSAIFAATALPQPKLTAVIDYHPADRGYDGAEPLPARHCQHRVAYAFPLTAAAKAWIAQASKPLNQEAFAGWLEEHTAELAAPTDDEKATFEALLAEKFAAPNDLVALARDLEIHATAKVRQGARTKSGERTLVYTDEHTNAADQPVDIPGLFMVALQAFVDGAVVRIPARLRYRLGPTGIAWHYDLFRVEHWLREQILGDLARVEEETALPCYQGSPEA
jgi:uncharacterized protein YfdQ (DUF2303 family)